MQLQSKYLHLLSLTAVLVAALVAGSPQRASAQSLLPGLGSDRSGTSGFQFTKITVDPRSAAMGNSNTADAMDGSSLYWNPALAVQVDRHDVQLNHTAYFAGISKEYVSYIHKLPSLAIGLSLQYLNSGDIDETTEFQPFGTGRTFRTVHMSAGLTVSQRLTNYFSYGLTVHYLTERIEEVEVSTASVDLGLFYRVAETGLRFSVGVNNFGFDADPTGETTRLTLDGDEVMDEFEKVQLPTTFNIGAAYDALDTETNQLTLTGQLTNPSDNSEKFAVGAEYGYLNQFFVRAGYQFGYEELVLPSFGAGVKVPFGGSGLYVDYAFTNYERLGSIHRVGLRVSI